MASGTVRNGRLRREHFVAAGLVGTVVVVVGFASGLGLRQPAPTTAQAQTRPAAPRVPPPTVQTTAAQPPPVATGGGGISGGGGAIPLPQPIHVTPDPTSHSAHPMPPSTTTPTTTPPTSTSVPPCAPGLVRNLTDTVDGTLGGLTGLLGLPSQPLDPLLDPLLGTDCQPTTTPSATP
jgi:hypothetical protein